MKLPFWATFCTLIAIVILCSLGFWQLERLKWKTAMIADLESVYSTDPMAFEFNSATLSNLPQEGQLIRGFAEGIYLHHGEILLGPRTHDGQPGYHVITPFETLDDAIILVNRGWIPLEAKDTGYSRPEEPLIVTGIARKPEEAGPFVPLNQPDAEAWHRLDPAQIADAKGLGDIAPYVLYADDTRPGYPLAAATKWQPRNNHLSYALFWFSMAGVLTIIFGLRFMRRRRI